jgi:serine/threonine protein kinase
MQRYAVKIVKMNIGVSETINTHKLFREVNTIKSLCSKYLVRYITCWAERDKFNNRMLESSRDLDESELSFLDSSLSEVNYSQISMSTMLSNEKFIQVNLHIQMEYCEGMNLKNFLDDHDRLIDRKANFSMMKKLLKGVKHIHEKNIIHRDLK